MDKNYLRIIFDNLHLTVAKEKLSDKKYNGLISRIIGSYYSNEGLFPVNFFKNMDRATNKRLMYEDNECQIFHIITL